MLKKALILADVHLKEDENELAQSYKLVKKFLRTNQFDTIVLLGDFMDCAALSRWNEDRRLELEGKRWIKEINLAQKELDYLSKYTKRIVYLEGNHEYWNKEYLERHPGMEGLIEIQNLLNLKQRQISWYPYADVHNIFKLGDLHLVHGYYVNKYHAHSHLYRYGCNLLYGHTHARQTAILNMKMQKAYQAWGVGCLCDMSPDYMKGKPANWINSFAIVEYDDTTGHFNVLEINIVDNQFIYQGKIYK